jgi:hypothetical protein
VSDKHLSDSLKGTAPFPVKFCGTPGTQSVTYSVTTSFRREPRRCRERMLVKLYAERNRFGSYDLKGVADNLDEPMTVAQGLSLESVVNRMMLVDMEIMYREGGIKDFVSYMTKSARGLPRDHVVRLLKDRGLLKDTAEFLQKQFLERYEPRSGSTPAPGR